MADTNRRRNYSAFLYERYSAFIARLSLRRTNIKKTKANNMYLLLNKINKIYVKRKHKLNEYISHR